MGKAALQSLPDHEFICPRTEQKMSYTMPSVAFVRSVIKDAFKEHSDAEERSVYILDRYMVNGLYAEFDKVADSIDELLTYPADLYLLWRSEISVCHGLVTDEDVDVIRETVKKKEPISKSS